MTPAAPRRPTTVTVCSPRKRIALGHLRLPEHIGARRQADPRRTRRPSAPNRCVCPSEASSSKRTCAICSCSEASRPSAPRARRRAHPCTSASTSVCCAFCMVKRAACGAVMPCREPLRLRGVFARRKADGTHAVRVGLQFNTPVSFIALPAVLARCKSAPAAPESGCTRRRFRSRPALQHRNGELRQSRNARARRLDLRRLRPQRQRTSSAPRGHSPPARSASQIVASPAAIKGGVTARLRFVRRHGIAVTGRIGHVIRRARQSRCRLHRRCAAPAASAPTAKAIGLLAAGQRRTARTAAKHPVLPHRFSASRSTYSPLNASSGHAAVLQRNIVRRDDRSSSTVQQHRPLFLSMQQPFPAARHPRRFLRASSEKRCFSSVSSCMRTDTACPAFTSITACGSISRSSAKSAPRRVSSGSSTDSRCITTGRKRVGNRKTVRIHRIRPVAFARCIGNKAHSAAGYRVPAFRLNRNASFST